MSIKTMQETLLAALGRRVSDAEVAVALDAHPTTVSRRGHAGNYKAAELVAIADYFNVSVSQILVESGLSSYEDVESYILGKSNGMTVERATDYELATELADRLRPPSARPAHWGQHVPYPADDYDLAASEQPDDDDNTLDIP